MKPFMGSIVGYARHRAGIVMLTGRQPSGNWLNASNLTNINARVLYGYNNIHA